MSDASIAVVAVAVVIVVVTVCATVRPNAALANALYALAAVFKSVLRR